MRVLAGSPTKPQCLKMPIVYRRGIHPKECVYVKLYAKVDITKQKNLKLTEGKNRQFSKKVTQTPRHKIVWVSTSPLLTPLLYRMEISSKLMSLKAYFISGV